VATLEYKLNGGWWLLAQLLVAEIKCNGAKEDYEEYCYHFAEYLGRYIANPSLLKDERRGIYGTTPR
jgi:hypothetical protein